MSSRLPLAASAVLPLLLLACSDSTVTTINKAPNVAITTPTEGQVMEIGTLAPTFSAVVEDDKTATEDMTLIWSLEGYGELAGVQTFTANGVSIEVEGELPVGNHLLDLMAVDGEGESGSDSTTFSVVANPVPDLTLVSPSEGDRVGLGDVVTVTLLVTDENQGDLTEIALEWGGAAEAHPDAPDHPDSLGQGEFYILGLEEGTQTLSVQATDSLGGIATASVWFDVVNTDADGDGHESDEFGGDDCDDDDDTTNPDGVELCDGVDSDCDGTIDEGSGDAIVFYADNDGDTYGDLDNTVEACDTPSGYTSDTQDCDDDDAAVNPDAVEVCDSIDNDCDGTVDGPGAADALTWYADADADTYGDPDVSTLDCTEPSGYVADATDCDDGATDVNPAATEICNGIDDNCDGLTDDSSSADAATWYADADTDGHGDAATPLNACEQPSGYVATDDDCDDLDDAVSPSDPEICNSIDDNCDGTIDEDSATDAATWYADTDTDGYGDPDSTHAACAEPTGYTSDDSDCDDGDIAVNPAAAEVCDGVDNNCDGTIDEDSATDASTWYADTDADTYGDADSTTIACDEPAGFVADDTDCDDGLADVNPAATELCNGIDDNCDGTTDEDSADDASTWYADGDSDTYGDASATTVSCEAPSGYVADSTDCDDTVGTTYPGADEFCDSVDNNCDGTVDEDSAIDAATWYADTDADTYGDASATVVQCTAPSGYVADDADCDDTVAAVNPAATEYCDAIDNDCDSTVDEDTAADATTWYADSDGDTYGDPDSTDVECYQPTDYVSDATDCDDAEATTNPGALEFCDGVDNNCDGTTDEDTAADAKDWYPDTDSDGFGDMSGTASTACYGASGYIDDNTDCDDTQSATYPGADETCDGADNDCDGTVDNDALDGDWYPADADGDGLGEPGSTDWVCEGPDNEHDCNDSDPAEPQVVDVTAVTSGADGSLDNPWTRIQDAMDNSNECVLVFAGTYFENLDFNGKNLTVSSVDGADTTVVDGTGGTTSVVTINSGETDVALSGFTLTAGEGYLEETSTSSACTSTTTCYEYYSTYYGGGIYIDGANATLSDLRVDGNELPAASTTASGDDTYYVYSYGGGIAVLNGTATFDGVDVTQNYADQGGGLYADASSTVDWTSSWISGNSATDGGGIEVDGGVLSLTNTIVSVNDASSGDGGAIVGYDATVTIVNSTLGLNLGSTGAGFYVSGTSVFDMANSILYGDSSGEGIEVDSGASYSGVYNTVVGFASNYSNTTDLIGVNGNLGDDPLFTDASDDGDYNNDDWTLTTGSPAIDAGNPNSAYDDADGTTNDMGTYGGPGSAW